jgi:hypothetical protein
MRLRLRERVGRLRLRRDAQREWVSRANPSDSIAVSFCSRRLPAGVWRRPGNMGWMMSKIWRGES